MSWKYVPTYARDFTTRESKYGLGSSPGDRWTSHYRDSAEPVEHRPVWAKTTTAKENPASVQRLKERYNGPDETRRETRAYKKSETKDLSSPTTGRPYGRSLTSYNLGLTDQDKRVSPLESRKILYMPSATTKHLTRKYSSDLSPTTLLPSPKFSKDESENEMIVVTRGTSPTPTASSVYLRSKRSDYGLERKVPRCQKKTETAHKEAQTDRELSLKFSSSTDAGIRSRPCGGNSYGGSKLRTYGLGFNSDCRRSISREESENATTPDSQKSLTSKPPTPTSPVKESEKKMFGRKSPPGNIRSSLKLDCAKTDLARNPNSPTRLSPLQCKIVNAETLQNAKDPQLPKVTVNCPDIDDVSSLSESSEEETSSEEEPAPMTVKKSVTNFLQNIPNQSRTSIFSKLGPQKINFKKIESGERAWWLESTDKVPEGMARIKSGRMVTGQEHDGNFLSPPYLVNRQFSRDKDWLKANSEDERETSEAHSPKEDKPSWNGMANGEPLTKAQVPCVENDFNYQMKFGQSADYLTDCSRECGVKDITQKLQNGLGSPLEEKNLLEPGDISGLISKAKAGLAKSKTKLDIKKSSSREMSPKVTDPKSEIDLYWKELADSLNRPLKLCDLDFTDLNSDDETDILGSNKANGEVPPPPPMLILPVPTLTPSKTVPAPPTVGSTALPRTRTPAPPPEPQIVKNKKTVKLFWKEVKDEPALKGKITDRSIIWDELVKIKVDTQKLEYLFESRAKDLMSKKQQEQNKNKEIIVLDPKRSNAINIGMTKLPPPRAIKTAILKMDSTVVNKEGIDKLLTMLPTEEEKVRIQEAQVANPDVPLGSAEQFLLTLASISELEARLRLWAFKLNFENNEKEICEPLMDLKQGMEILRVNKTFRAILSTLLSIGNFLNGYDVKGFQIEYLSKVPEVKDTVHKHSLLHHLCIIIMEKFPDSTDLYSEIGAVTRASKVDFDELAGNMKRVEEECKLSWNYLKMIAKHEGHTAMKVKMSDFLADCAERIIVVGMVHKRIINRFKKFAFWLGVPMNRISTTRPHEIFKVISEFALEYRTTRDRVLQQIKKMNREKSRAKGLLNSDPNDLGTRKLNSKEAKDEARLKQVLENGSGYSENTSTWRRQRKDTRNLLQEANNDDEEILDALIKTAKNQVSSPRLKERRRSRIYGKYCERNLTRLHLWLK